MECRSKRSMGLTRQVSNAGTEVARKRASFQKRSSINKQASTQTEPYEDIFLSDDSGSSNEDANTNMNTLLNSKNQINNNYEDATPYESFETNILIPDKINESFDQIASNNNNNSNNSSLNSATLTTQRTTRHRRYKKFSKRRKSLPSQGSSNEEPHTVTLIPRGPLICSNNENNWLPDRFSGSLVNTSCDHEAYNSKISYNSNSNNSNSCNTAIASVNTSTSNLSITPSTISTATDPLVKPSIDNNNQIASSPQTKIITKSKSKNNSIKFCSSIPSTVNYDVNIIKTTVYNATNSSKSTLTDSKKICSRMESDFYLNDFIDDYHLDDDTGMYSSNEDDPTNDIMKKLKEVEKVFLI